MIEEVRRELNELSEEGYRRFSEKLIPGVGGLMGVRVPHLHRIAKWIVKSGYVQRFLEQADDSVYEEKILQALVIGYSRAGLEETLSMVKDFVPKIDNWGVCDIFCGNLGVAKKNKDAFFNFIMPYLDSDREYDVRFGMVMLLDYFVDERYIDSVFELIDDFRHEGYYARMGAAWTLSMCYFRFPDRTAGYLKYSRLDDWTYNKGIGKMINKGIGKMIESRRLSDEEKDMLRSMKRK